MFEKNVSCFGPIDFGRLFWLNLYIGGTLLILGSPGGIEFTELGESASTGSTSPRVSASIEFIVLSPGLIRDFYEKILPFFNKPFSDIVIRLINLCTDFCLFIR